MDNWLYKVLKDTAALRQATDEQGKTLLKRILDTLFPNRNVP
jgi:hypothetical protein